MEPFRSRPASFSFAKVQAETVNIRTWIPVLVVSAIVALALTGVAGGGAAPRLSVAGNGARLETEIPDRLRSGLIFESRIAVVADRPLSDVTIGISPEVWRQITVNTVSPEPESEGFKDGEFRLHFGPLKAGERIEVRLEAQVNPGRWGVAEGMISIRDDETLLVSRPQQMWVFP